MVLATLDNRPKFAKKSLIKKVKISEEQKKINDYINKHGFSIIIDKKTGLSILEVVNDK